MKGVSGAMDLVAGVRRVVAVMQHVDKYGNAKLVKECSLPHGLWRRSRQTRSTRRPRRPSPAPRSSPRAPERRDTGGMYMGSIGNGDLSASVRRRVV